MSELDEIFPVARIKVFTGEYKLYTDMSELDKEIKEVDVYSKEQVLKLLKPQLTIPKSVADLLDEIPNEAKEYVRVNDFGEYSVLDDFVELREFYEADEDDIFPKFMELKDFVKDNLNLCVIYLAGKALGVDLVKVV